MTNPKAWKLILFIKNGEVFYQDHDQGIQIKVDDLVDGNKLLLGMTLSFQYKIWISKMIFYFPRDFVCSLAPFVHALKIWSNKLKC